MSLNEINCESENFIKIEKTCENLDLFSNFLSENDENNESKKKVRFPEEKSIVSDYFEAKNYWNEKRFCSAEELLASYKKSCEFYNIKPIPILVEQVKGIDGGLCDERYDMLNLSNVKLDLKHVESMEEIFKRVQFKTLNFENTTLDDESASSLFEIIEYYESCLKLNLSHNGKISYSGFNACSKMLKKTPCLETIELKGIIFTDTTIPPINRALRCGSNLRILHLENSNICSKNLLILSSALKLNLNLKELHLAGNRMVPSDGIQLGSLLKANKLLETLDVRNNSLGDVGLSHICDGIADQSQIHLHKPEHEMHDQGLLCLILWSNSITYNGMPSLSDSLKATKSLQSLNLGNNPISSEGIHIIREGLLSNRTLQRLSLPCCKITCEGGVAIAEYLADTKQLMRLDIRDNDIRTAGLMAISLSMRVNKSVIRLDVDPNPKKDPNVKGFAETQTESLKIIHQRILENKKIALVKQEMELSQSFSLSIQPQDSDEINSIKNLNHNDFHLTDTSVISEENVRGKDPLKMSESLDASESIETTEPTEDSDYMSESYPSFEKSNVPLSLDLSPDIDSNMVFFNDFSSKVLSPTDTILEFAIQSAFQLEESENCINTITCYNDMIVVNDTLVTSLNKGIEPCDNDKRVLNDPLERSLNEEIMTYNNGKTVLNDPLVSSLNKDTETCDTDKRVLNDPLESSLNEDIMTYNIGKTVLNDPLVSSLIKDTLAFDNTKKVLNDLLESSLNEDMRYTMISNNDETVLNNPVENSVKEDTVKCDNDKIVLNDPLENSFNEDLTDTMTCDNDKTLLVDPLEISLIKDTGETKDGDIQYDDSIENNDQTQNTLSFIKTIKSSEEPLSEDSTESSDSYMKKSLEL